MQPDEFLPLTALSFHILLALTRGAAHGYAIGDAIEEASGGAIEPTTGSLYQALKRMQDEGLLQKAPTPEGERSGGPPRLYFQLTELGRAVARMEAERLAALMDIARDAALLPPGVGSVG